MPTLIEGLPVKGSIHNEDGRDHYRFEIKHTEGYEKEIKIQTTPIVSKVQMFVSTTGKAGPDNNQWST